MKKQAITIVSGLLLLVFALSGCGSQATNSGQTSDGSAAAKAAPVAVHSGGCWSRNGDLASHADLGQSTDPTRWQVGNSPYFGAKIISCQGLVYLSWSTGYDFYQIRWARPGVSEQQFSTSEQGSHNFGNAHFSTIYTFKLQGCNSTFWGGSSCSDWSPTVSVATYYPGECHVGYVWRGANASDYVCVTPTTRDQAAYDNSQRYNRIDPNGAYGPNTCVQGYVWREAYSGDVVCVTPAVRSQAAYDNSQASARSYHNY